MDREGEKDRKTQDGSQNCSHYSAHGFGDSIIPDAIRRIVPEIAGGYKVKFPGAATFELPGGLFSVNPVAVKRSFIQKRAAGAVWGFGRGFRRDFREGVGCRLRGMSGMAAVVLLVAVPATGLAADPGATSGKSDAENPPREESPGDIPPEGQAGFVERYHEALSLKLDAIIRGLDTYFVEEKTDEGYKGNRLRVRLGESFTARGAPDFMSSFRLDASFPRTQRRLGLLIQNESVTGDDDPQSLEENPGEKSNLTAALRFFVVDSKHFSTNLDSGVRFRPRPDPYVKGRGAYQAYLTTRLLVRPTEFLFWQYEDGVGERTRLDFDLAVRDKALFRIRADGLWKKSDEGYRYLGKVLFREQLSSRRGYEVSGTLIGYTHLEPVVTKYQVAFLWRQMIYRKWLALEIKPFIDFWEEDDYYASPGITTTLEINFQTE